MQLITKIKNLICNFKDWNFKIKENKRGVRLTKEQIKEMKEYFKLGFSANEIANRTFISRNTVYKYMKQFRKGK